MSFYLNMDNKKIFLNNSNIKKILMKNELTYFDLEVPEDNDEIDEFSVNDFIESISKLIDITNINDFSNLLHYNKNILIAIIYIFKENILSNEEFINLLKTYDMENLKETIFSLIYNYVPGFIRGNEKNEIMNTLKNYFRTLHPNNKISNIENLGLRNSYNNFFTISKGSLLFSNEDYDFESSNESVGTLIYKESGKFNKRPGYDDYGPYQSNIFNYLVGESQYIWQEYIKMNNQLPLEKDFIYPLIVYCMLTNASSRFESDTSYRIDFSDTNNINNIIKTFFKNAYIINKQDSDNRTINTSKYNGYLFLPGDFTEKILDGNEEGNNYNYKKQYESIFDRIDLSLSIVPLDKLNSIDSSSEDYKKIIVEELNNFENLTDITYSLENGKITSSTKEYKYQYNQNFLNIFVFGDMKNYLYKGVKDFTLKTDRNFILTNSGNLDLMFYCKKFLANSKFDALINDATKDINESLEKVINEISTYDYYKNIDFGKDYNYLKLFIRNLLISYFTSRKNGNTDFNFVLDDVFIQNIYRIYFFIRDFILNGERTVKTLSENNLFNRIVSGDPFNNMKNVDELIEEFTVYGESLGKSYERMTEEYRNKLIKLKSYFGG